MIKYPTISDILKPILGPKVKEIQYHLLNHVKHRDALRDLKDDIESILDSVEDGVELLESGVDKLSELL